MSLDNISQARLALVHPALAAIIVQMEEFMEDGGGLRVAQGLRTYAEQDTLYAQGRTTPGKIVTNAQGGFSWHNFGLAVDCYPNNIDGSIDWNPQHPDWNKMELLGESLGLTSGATWTRLVDAPHFQITGKLLSEPEPNNAVRSLMASGGIQAVWAAADINKGE